MRITILQIWHWINFISCEFNYSATVTVETAENRGNKNGNRWQQL